MDTVKTEVRMLPLGAMARVLHVPAKWLRTEAEAGRIPALRAGSRLVFRPDVVVPLVAERAAGGAG